MNAASAISITLFLPRVSAKIPESGEINKANKAVVDVIRDLSIVDNGCPREDLIETNVAEMTPVSSRIPCQLRVPSTFPVTEGTEIEMKRETNIQTITH
jgi:hypothetical protein